MPYKKILVAIDIYEDSTDIVREAQLIAKNNHAELHFAYTLPHVITSIPYAYDFQKDIQEEAKDKLKDLQKQTGETPSHIHLLHGNPKSEICELGKTLGADLIITGSHGKHGLDLLLGSIANGILHLAKSDVLTVRVNKKNKHMVSEHYRNIIVATDLDADNQKIMETAQTIAKRYSANLHVINAIPHMTTTAMSYYPNMEHELKVEAEKQLKVLAQKLSANAQHFKAEIGLPKNVIIDAAKEANAELIVIGSHGRKAIGSAIIGSTANAVLHAAKQDVLVVKI